MKRFYILFLPGIFLTGLLLNQTAAQETTPEVTEPVAALTEEASPETPDALAETQDANPQPEQAQVTQEPAPLVLKVVGSEPTRVTSGSVRQLSIFGENFTPDTAVRLVGFGFLNVNFINTNSLVATIPADARAGTYPVEVSDPQNGTSQSPQTLQIAAPPATSAPLPTAIPTLPPPTPVPGQPSLIIRSFRSEPAVVQPGGRVRFTVEVFNQGTRAAQNVTAAIESNGDFFPASNQTTVSLATIQPGQRSVFPLEAVAAASASGGTSSITINFTFRDFENATYNNSGIVTVEVAAVAQMSQLTITGYQFAPNPVLPGEEVIVSALLANTGTEDASQVLLRVPPDVLLPGIRGNSFPVGDVRAGTTITVQLPLVVSSDVSSGAQSQTINLAYFQGDEMKSTDSDMTILVDAPRPSSILLNAYDIGQESVQPGERFTLNATLTNIGEASIPNALVSFALVKTDGSIENNDFTTIGGGGTIFLEEIPANGTPVEIEQEFIVNGDVNSGVYTLPIVITYNNRDDSEGREVLNASIVVLVPPRIRFFEEIPVPEQVDADDVFDISVAALNLGLRDINLLFATIEGENLEILSLPEVLLNPLRPGDDILIDGQFRALEAGDATITLTLFYINDLNQEATITQTYNLVVEEPPLPPPTAVPVETMLTPVPLPEAQNAAIELPDDFVPRLLLGLLGLGR